MIASDLMDFTDEPENDENSCPDDVDENTGVLAPGLVGSPVIVNSILKQSTKDNLIQLYTPVQKPVKGKLKVHFGHDSLLQTPSVKQSERKRVCVNSPIKEDTEQKTAQAEMVTTVDTDQEDKDNWIERTSVLTKQDHQECLQYTREILHDIINNIPIKEDIDSSRSSADSGIDDDAMETSQCAEDSTTSLATGESTTSLTTEDSTTSLATEDSTTSQTNTDSTTSPATEDTKTSLATEDSTTSQTNTDSTTSPATEDTKTSLTTEDSTTSQGAGDTSPDTGMAIIAEPTTVQEKEPNDFSNENSILNDLLADAENLLRGLATEEANKDIKTETDAQVNTETVASEPKLEQTGETIPDSKPLSEEKPAKEIINCPVVNAEAVNEVTADTVEGFDTGNTEEEAMDCEEAMDVDLTINVGGEAVVAAPAESSGDMADEIKDKNNAKPEEGTQVLMNDVTISTSVTPEPNDNKKKGEMTSSIENKPTKGEMQTNDTENNSKKSGKSSQKKKVGEDSSDEEFMSADEAMEVDVIETPRKPDLDVATVIREIQQPVSDSPLRTPPKVGYSLNFDDMETLNPFGTTKSIMNSPDNGTVLPQQNVPKANSKQAVVEEEEKMDKNEEFKSANASPEKMDPSDKQQTIQSVETAKSKAEVNVDKQIGESDPFMTKSQVLNTPDKLKNLQTDKSQTDLFKATKQIINTPDQQETAMVNTTELSSITTSLDNAQGVEDKIENSPETVTVEAEALETVSAPATVSSPAIQMSGKGSYDLDSLGIQEHATVKDVTQTSEEKTTDIEEASNKDETDEEKFVSDSPALPVTRGAYNLDNLDLEEAGIAPKAETTVSKPESATSVDDTTETKIGVVPPTKTEESHKETSEEIEMKNNEVCNAPISDSPALPVTRGAYNLDALDFDDADPFKPKQIMANSPDSKCPGQNGGDAADPFKTKSKVVDSPVTSKKPSSKTNKAKTKLDKKCVESETKSEEKENINENTKAVNEQSEHNSNNNSAETMINLDEIEDPFKPKAQMQNSPAVKTSQASSFDNESELDDPFKPKKQMINSPTCKADQLDILDLDNLDDIDPFKPKQQMVNSPIGKPKETEGFDFDNLDGVNPFEPKKQMQNSPAGEKVNQTAKEPFDFDGLDQVNPFLPIKQMANSPVGKSAKDESLGLDEIEDPFKPKTQMINSPVSKSVVSDKAEMDINDEIDPFNSKKQIINSPASKPTVAPETNNTEMDVNVEIDPFKPKKQMQNSPGVTKSKTSSERKDNSVSSIAAFADLDPFQTKQKVSVTPEKAVLATDDMSDVDPFKSSKQMANSPVTNNARSSHKAPEIVSAIRTLSSVCEDEGEEEPFLEVQGVTRRGEQPDDAKVNGQFDGLDIDENQFVSASQVFNDPGVWEMLEQFGSTTAAQTSESCLNRMSLYVKFDPLVDAAPNNPRRISIRPSQLEKMKEFGLDETLLLLGTPPKKRRQSIMSLNKTPTSGRNTPTLGANVASRRRETITTQQGAVDLIMEFSPKKKTECHGEGLPNVTSGEPLTLMEDGAEDDLGLFQELKYTDSDLKKLRENMKLLLQGQLIAKDQEWCKREEAWQKEKEELKMAIRDKHLQYKAEQDAKAQMVKVVEMFEGTINQIALEKDKAEKHTEEVKLERDQALQDILSVENSFSELHKRYEKFKVIFESMKKNEESLKKYVDECKDKQKETEEKYKTLKKSSDEKIARLSSENEKLTKEKAADHNKAEAQHKIITMKLDNLEKTLAQKVEENKQLTEICDNLLAKVGD